MRLIVDSTTHHEDWEGNMWGDVLTSHGAAIICFASRRWFYSNTGEYWDKSWDIPMIQTDASGTPCSDESSIDLLYVDAVLEAIQNDPEKSAKLDLSKVWINGFSSGSEMSSYQAHCQRKRRGADFVQGFSVTHGGLNNKDVQKDRENMINSENWTPGDAYAKEQWWPFVPEDGSSSHPLKACLFDGTADEPYYTASKYLRDIWTGIGYPVYASYLQGGTHGDFESFNKAMGCLDDGTGDLIKYGPPMSNLAMGKADTVGNATKTFNVTEAGNWGIVRVAPGHPD